MKSEGACKRRPALPLATRLGLDTLPRLLILMLIYQSGNSHPIVGLVGYFDFIIADSAFKKNGWKTRILTMEINIEVSRNGDDENPFSSVTCRLFETALPR